MLAPHAFRQGTVYAFSRAKTVAEPQLAAARLSHLRYVSPSALRIQAQLIGLLADAQHEAGLAQHCFPRGPASQQGTIEAGGYAWWVVDGRGE